MSGALRIAIGGIAQVYCVHDRPKRQILTTGQVAELGRSMGQTFDPKQHKVFLCACCQNLFVDPTDFPRLCTICMGVPVHTLEAQLPEPTGAIDG